MSTVRAMQEWCRLQCQNYPGVEIRDFSTSFRDGMAFCALIHRHRPDLLDFDTLSKDNVYENNQLAFEVAEQQLGIPALLDPTDMVTMKVPDRLSILTYLSQYYNYFRNPPAGVSRPLAMKRSAALCSSEPALKKTTESTSVPQSEEESSEPTRQTLLNSTCASCHQHVHLVQRYLVEGRLYHRHCFRCKECCSTLLPGSYRPGLESGTYVCTHHRSKGISISQSTPDNLKDDGVILRKEDLDKDQKWRKDDRLNAVGDVSVSVSLPAAINEAYDPSSRPSVANRSEENSTSNLEAEYGVPADPVSEHPHVVQSPHEQTSVANLRPKIQLKPAIPCKPTSLQDQKCAASQVNHPSGLQTSITVQEQIGNSPNIDHRQASSSVKNQDQISSHNQKDDPVDDLMPSNIDNRTAASSVSCVPTEERTVTIPSDPTDTAASVNNELQMPDPESRKGELENRPIPAARRATGAVVSQLPPPVPRPRTSFPGDRENETGPLAITEVTNGAQLEELTPPVPKPRVRPKSSERMVNGRQHKEPPWIALVQMEKKRKAAPPPPGTPPRATADDQHSSPSQDREGRPSSRKSPQPKPYNPFEDDEEEEEASESLLAPGHPWYGITPTSSPKARKRAAPKAPGASPIARHSSLLSASRVSHSEPSSCTPSPALSIESLSSDSPLNETVSKSSSEPTVHAAIVDTANATPAPASVSANELANHGTGSAASPSSSRSSSCGSLRSSPHRPPPKPPAPTAAIVSASEQSTSAPSPPPPPKTPPKSSCKENPFNRKASPAASPVISSSVRKSTKGPKPARPPAPGHGFPLVKRKVQADEYIPEEDIHGELNAIERQLDEMELRGIELEGKLRSVDSETVDDDELLVDWFRLIHEKHMLVRRESELVYVIKQQNLEQRQADVEYELRCLLNKPEKDWTDDDRDREQVLMKEIVIIIEQRNAIVTCLDEDRQREEEEDKLLAAMIKKKDFLKDPEVSMTKKKGKFKPLKVLKRLSAKPDPKTKSPSDKSDKS